MIIRVFYLGALWWGMKFSIEQASQGRREALAIPALIVGGVIMGFTLAGMIRVACRLKAYRLLMSHLTPRQRLTMLVLGVFWVNGSDGQSYCIRSRWVGNVKHRTSRRSHTTFCAHPKGVPLYDAMLAQKLLIETDVNKFKYIAHASFYPL